MVIDHLNGRFPRSDHIGVIYVYIDYQDQERQKPTNVLANFLIQLLCRLESWPSEIETTYTDCVKRRARPDFETLLNLFEIVSRQFRGVYVMIDAFDELDTELRPTFMSLIRKLSQHSIKTMVTSRPHPEITHELEECGLRLGISAMDSDITKYIEYRLNKKGQLSSSLKHKIAETLNTSGADGM